MTKKQDRDRVIAEIAIYHAQQHASFGAPVSGQTNQDVPDAAVKCGKRLPELARWQRSVVAIIAVGELFYRRLFCSQCVSGMAASQAYLAWFRWWRW